MQGELFDIPAYLPGATIQERFAAFHAANPWVYRAIVRLARQAKARGHGNYGIKSIIEVLRWEWQAKTNDPHAEWKINNDYSSRYARLIDESEPDLKGFFRLRELQAA